MSDDEDTDNDLHFEVGSDVEGPRKVTAHIGRIERASDSLTFPCGDTASAENLRMAIAAKSWELGHEDNVTISRKKPFIQDGINRPADVVVTLEPGVPSRVLDTLLKYVTSSEKQKPSIT